MDCAVISYSEGSSICAQECEEIIGKKPRIEHNVCVLEDVSQKEVAMLCYYAQSALRIIPLYAILPCKTQEDLQETNLEKKLNNNILQITSTRCTSFGVQTEKLTQHPVPSMEISRILGSFIQAKTNLAVELTAPDLPLIAYVVGELIFFGVDVCGISLTKRPYKIFTQSSSLNGPFAYTVARLGGVSKNSIVVDPFCGSATIPIEVGLFQEGISCYQFENKFAGKNIPYFKEDFKLVQSSAKNVASKNDKTYGFDTHLKIMQGAQKNAKLAGVFKAVTISKVDIEWIDAKFPQGGVDFIVTNPPKESKRLGNGKEIAKIYDELFYQARFILAPTGRAVILSNTAKRLDELAQRHGFTKEKELKITAGQQPYILLVYRPPKQPNS